MKTALVLFAALAAASAKSFSIRSFEYGFCAGAAVSLQVLITLLEEIPAGAGVSVKIKKDGLIDIPIPCLDIDGISIGSCDYDGGELLAAAADFLCPTYVPEGQACALPLGTGQYGGQEPLSVVLPELPALIVDLLASGTYEASATVNYADGSQMTCIQAKIDVTSGF